MAATVYQGETAKVSQWEAVLAECAAADVVIIGEMHNHARGLAVTNALWQDITGKAQEAALALEFVERDQQVPLDDYLKGVTTDNSLRDIGGRDHMPLIDWAKATQRSVYAANAPRRYAQIARIDGWEGLHALTLAQQETFVLPSSRTSVDYRERFGEALSQSGLKHQDGTVEDYLRSQELWDATMADTVAKAWDAGARPIVLVVGRFHSDYHGGVEQYVRALMPEVDLLTVSLIDVDRDDDQVDAGRADWVLDVGEQAEAQ